MKKVFFKTSALFLVFFIATTGLFAFSHLRVEASMPNLLVDAQVSNANPSAQQAFKYRIRYRVASVTEHAFNSTITFSLNDALSVVSAPLVGGNVTNVQQSGNQFTINLASPASAGAPAGALAAGSSGLIEVSVKFKCADDVPAGVVAGSTISMDMVPNFSVTGVSADAPNNPLVTVPALSACIVPVPQPPSTEFRKSSISEIAAPGGELFYNLSFPAHGTSAQVIDDIPEGMKVYQMITNNITDWTVEFDCGNGYHAMPITAFGINSVSGWINTQPVGGELLDDVGMPSGCIVGSAGDFDDGNTLKVIENADRLRITSPAGGSSFKNLQLRGIADRDISRGDQLQNCVEVINNPATWVNDCAEVTFYLAPALNIGKTVASNNPGLGSTVLNNDPNLVSSPAYAGLQKDAMDIEWEITVNPQQFSPQGADGFIVEDLLPDGIDFVSNPDNPNYWVVHTGSELDASTCGQPIFSRIENYNGTGRVLLRWEFPACYLPAYPVASSFALANYRLTIFLSTRWMATTSLPAGFILNDLYLRLANGYHFHQQGSSGLNDRAVYSGFYSVPSSGGDLNSAKYVKGALDEGDFHRYPVVGNTNLSGDGDYEIYIYNHSFNDIRTLDIVDILGHIGDEDLLTGTARGSEWSAELAGDLVVERYKVGVGLEDASALIQGGIQYANTTDVCYLDASDQVKINGTLPASCTALSTAVAADGARSFGFQWEDTAAPLRFGEYLKITLPIRQLAGEADMTDGEVNWNSFAYTATQTDGFELFSAEPLKVGLKMIDETSTAAIGNRVWIDENANGVQDAGELSVSGVQVSLYNQDGTPVTQEVLVNGVATQVPITTTTNGNGEYCFYGLNPSTAYRVRLDRPADFQGSGALANYVLSAADQAADDIDTDASMGDNNAMSDLAPEIEAMSPVAGQKDSSFDFGFYKTASIGNYAWLDADANGLQDDTEVGAAGIDVALHRANGTLVSTTTTNNSGIYNFSNVAPGAYYLAFSNLPAGLVATAQSLGGNAEKDSDVNPTTNQTAVFNIAACTVNNEFDFGLRMPPANPASIAGTVWDELSKNGLFDNIENALAGIQVNLLDDLGLVLATTTTDVDGNYSFNNLVPNQTYNISVSLPHINAEFTVAGADMDVDMTTGITTSPIMPAPDEDITDVDAGICGLLSLGNQLFIDANENGSFDAGEAVLPNVDVFLIDANDNTTVLAQTTSDANGRYLFPNLDAAAYIVEVSIPDGYESTIDIATASMPNAADHDDNGITTNGAMTSVRSAAITLDASGGPTASAHHSESDADIVINGMNDLSSNKKGYYTVDFGFRPVSCDCTISGPNMAAQNSEQTYMAPSGAASYTWSISAGNATIVGADDQNEVTVNIATGSSTITLMWTQTDGCMGSCTFDVSALTCPPNVRCGSVQVQRN